MIISVYACQKYVVQPFTNHKNNFRRGFKYWFVSIRMKKGNIVPIHKKGDKQVLKNYHPVSLLPICGEIFERLIFNEMFRVLLENLVSLNQSGFKPGDSCTNQPLSITHEIFQTFDERFEVRSVFLDIFKAFDKI